MEARALAAARRGVVAVEAREDEEEEVEWGAAGGCSW